MAQVPQDLLDRIRELEEAVRRLEGRSQIRPAQDQILGGSVTVGNGGIFRVLDTDGSSLLYTGGIGPAHPDGSPQRGTLMYRETGEMALALYTTTSGPQDLVIMDMDANHVLKTGPLGLKKPWIPVGLYPGYPSWATTWPSTSSATMEQVLIGEVVKAAERIRVVAMVSSSAGGVTGEAQVFLNNVAIGSPQAVGFAFDWLVVTTDLPGSVGDTIQIEVRARVTGGAGSIRARAHSAWCGGDM
ncbi:hypothetical protein [Yinghuangia soli]|uniref:Uncharacterized protein n=1 Tax=Yinghuangia soli TaxID=2908204 RepID=A0AA41Q5S7_9ACTN|nr:hypothetical protein [Yinghuangia soli]MCF2531757.1 hypothetical protein [Yinghuangia soli]